MHIHIDFEEEMDVLFDQGKKDIIITLQNKAALPEIRLDLEMDGETFTKLLKEMNEFAKGEI